MGYLNSVFAELWLIRMVMDLALFAFYLVLDVDDAVFKSCFYNQSLMKAYSCPKVPKSFSPP